ncbi:MAG: hypothetical protein J6I64_07870, partial [Lachnospiraceae bacterium]|nr:hypothetical protein [Lachnospiraceae bacterium]
LSSLLPGQYLLVEDQAPAGYLLTAPVEFTLSSDQFLTVVEMANTPTPPEEPVPTSSEGASTGDASSLSLCCWCALVSGSIAFLLRKKFANFHRSSHS